MHALSTYIRRRIVHMAALLVSIASMSNQPTVIKRTCMCMQVNGVSHLILYMAILHEPSFNCNNIVLTLYNGIYISYEVLSKQTVSLGSVTHVILFFCLICLRYVIV
jgi:hypothetical protein